MDLNSVVEKQLRTAFDEADADGSGFCDAQESVSLFATMFPRASIVKILSLVKECDVSHDGLISYSEFKATALKLLHRPPRPSSTAASSPRSQNASPTSASSSVASPASANPLRPALVGTKTCSSAAPSPTRSLQQQMIDSSPVVAASPAAIPVRAPPRPADPPKQHAPAPDDEIDQLTGSFVAGSLSAFWEPDQQQHEASPDVSAIPQQHQSAPPPPSLTRSQLEAIKAANIKEQYSVAESAAREAEEKAASSSAVPTSFIDSLGIALLKSPETATKTFSRKMLYQQLFFEDAADILSDFCFAADSALGSASPLRASSSSPSRTNMSVSISFSGSTTNVSIEPGKVLSILRMLLVHLNELSDDSSSDLPSSPINSLILELQQLALVFCRALTEDFLSIRSLHPDARTSIALFLVDWRRVFPLEFCTVVCASNGVRESVSELLLTVSPRLFSPEDGALLLGSGDACFCPVSTMTPLEQPGPNGKELHPRAKVLHPRTREWTAVVAHEYFSASAGSPHRTDVGGGGELLIALRLGMELLLSHQFYASGPLHWAAATGLPQLCEIVLQAMTSDQKMALLNNGGGGGSSIVNDSTVLADIAGRLLDETKCAEGETFAMIAAWSGATPCLRWALSRSSGKKILAAKKRDGTTMTAMACLGAQVKSKAGSEHHHFATRCVSFCVENGGGPMPAWSSSC